MMPNTPFAAGRARRSFWLAQVGSVVILTALAWFLPELVVVETVTALQMPLLIAALVAIPLVFIATRYLVPRPRPPQARDALRGIVAPLPKAVGLGPYLVALALCEIPIILGLVAVLTGGSTDVALVLGLASLLLLCEVRPGSRGR